MALQGTNTPVCRRHAVGEGLELAVPRLCKISAAPEASEGGCRPWGRVHGVSQARAPAAKVSQEVPHLPGRLPGLQAAQGAVSSWQHLPWLHPR